MGVEGLWQLLAPAGKPVTLESLDGKVLAVDASIWITSFIKVKFDHRFNAANIRRSFNYLFVVRCRQCEIMMET